MTLPKLTPTQISALVVLMAHSRPLSNPEMKELAGFDLTGSDKNGLNDHGLIHSYRVGRSFTHELTDRGWRMSRDVLRVDAIGGTGPARGALRVLMAALDRGLQRRDIQPADFFYAGDDPTPSAAPPDLEKAIRVAYRERAAQPRAWVGLADIRDACGTASRADVDAALRALATQADVRIVPSANLKALTPRDEAAAIRLGGEFKHAIAIEG